MWTRDRKYISAATVTLPYGKPGPMQGGSIVTTVQKTLRTDFWFNHYCEGFEHKKIKGKVRPPDHKKMRTYENGYLIKYCQCCGAKMTVDIQDYFSKALELWRLSRP